MTTFNSDFSKEGWKKQKPVELVMMVRKCWAVFGTFQMKWGRSMSITRTPRGKREAGVSTSFRFRICSSIKPTHFLVHLHFSLDADGRVEQKNRLLASFSYFFQWNCLAFNHVAQCTGVSCSQSTFIYVFTFLKDYLNLCKSFVPLFCFVFFKHLLTVSSRSRTLRREILRRFGSPPFQSIIDIHLYPPLLCFSLKFLEQN